MKSRRDHGALHEPDRGRASRREHRRRRLLAHGHLDPGAEPRGERRAHPGPLRAQVARHGALERDPRVRALVGAASTFSSFPPTSIDRRWRPWHSHERGRRGNGTAPHTWKLKLYIAGQTPRSMAALPNLKKIVDEHLGGQYEIEVIDLLENPQLAKGDQILAVPTLVKDLPLPCARSSATSPTRSASWSGSTSGRRDGRTSAHRSRASRSRSTSKRRRPATRRYVLRLYVTGQTPRSLRAIENIKRICEQHLARPLRPRGHRHLPAPKPRRGRADHRRSTLVKTLPAPIRRFVGDLSDTEKILFGLDLIPKTRA